MRSTTLTLDLNHVHDIPITMHVKSKDLHCALLDARGFATLLCTDIRVIHKLTDEHSEVFYVNQLTNLDDVYKLRESPTKCGTFLRLNKELEKEGVNFNTRHL